MWLVEIIHGWANKNLNSIKAENWISSVQNISSWKYYFLCWRLSRETVVVFNNVYMMSCNIFSRLAVLLNLLWIDSRRKHRLRQFIFSSTLLLHSATYFRNSSCMDTARSQFLSFLLCWFMQICIYFDHFTVWLLMHQRKLFIRQIFNFIFICWVL